MKEMKIYGRGGQGAVTAAEILISAALKDGNYGLERPIIGAERRGAPISVMVRIDKKPVLITYQPKKLDVIAVFDTTLLRFINVAEELKDRGFLIINGLVPPEELRSFNTICVDATFLAVKHRLGSIRDPIINTGMLGAFAKLGIVSFESLLETVKEQFADDEKKLSKNMAMVKESFETAKIFPAAETNAPIKQSLSANSKYMELREKAKTMIESGEMLLLTSLEQSMFYNKTGAWRTTGRPVLKDKSLCSKCGYCWFYCPDVSIGETEDGYPHIDYDFCKGCGICANVCPKKIIVFEEE